MPDDPTLVDDNPDLGVGQDDASELEQLRSQLEDQKRRNSGLQRKVQELVNQTSQPEPAVTQVQAAPTGSADNPYETVVRQMLEERVAAKYPAVAPLMDLLAVEDPRDLLKLAETVNERLKKTESGTSEQLPPPPGADLGASNPPSVPENLDELIRQARDGGNYQELIALMTLKAKQ